MIKPISRQWAIAIALHIIMALSGMVLFAKGVFFPSLIAEFGFTHLQTSLLFSVNSIAGCVTALLVGWLLFRRHDARLVLLLPMILLALANGIAAAAHDYRTLMVAYILMGSFNVCAVAIPVLVTNWFSDNRGLALGLGFSGSTTSGVLLSPLLGTVVEHWGWRAGYLTVGALILVILPPLILLVIRTRPQVEPEPRAVQTASTSGLTLIQAARTPDFWLIIVAYSTYMAHTGGYLVHFVASLGERGFGLAQASTVMSALFLLAALSKFLFGYVADRWRPGTLAVGSLITASVGFVVLGASTGIIGLILFTLLYGLTYSVPMVLFPLIVQDTFGRAHFATIDATLVVGSIAIGGWAGPLVVGSVYDHSHSYGTAYITLAALPALGALSMFIARYRRSRGTGWTGATGLGQAA